MKFLKTLMAVAAVATATPTLAAPTIFFGENQNPSNLVSGNPLTARNNFFAQLTGNSTEDFEGLSTGSSPSSLTFAGSAGNIVASLSGSGTIITGLGTGAGRFPTSGIQSYETNANFGASFSSAIAAFGFYATDIGDFSGQLKITLIRAGGNEILTVPHTINGNSGSLLFYGVIDTANPFTGVQFSTTDGDDFFGFDDITVGDIKQVTGGAVPEPATWAMMIGGFGMVGSTMRYRRRKTKVTFA